MLMDQWPSCEKYYMVDLWKQQKSYEDVANVDDTQQNALLAEAMRNTAPYKHKTKILRGFTSEMAKSIPDGELDFVYVDARHDYCGVMEDLDLYWPKCGWPFGRPRLHGSIGSSRSGLERVHGRNQKCRCSQGSCK
jgi:hypothetical protein